MNTTTKQVTKAATKSTTKAAPKAASKAKGKTLAYAAILAEALAAKYGDKIKGFYVSAIAYHAKKGTSFPRARNASEPLMSVDDAREFLAKHAATSIPAGSKAGQRLFDAMMTEAPQVIQNARKASK